MLPAPETTSEAPRLTGLQFQFVQLYLTQCRADAVAAVRMMSLSEDERVLRQLNALRLELRRAVPGNREGERELASIIDHTLALLDQG